MSNKKRYAVQVVDGIFPDMEKVLGERHPIPTKLEYDIFNFKNRANEPSILCYVDNNLSFFDSLEGSRYKLIQDRASVGSFFEPKVYTAEELETTSDGIGGLPSYVLPYTKGGVSRYDNDNELRKAFNSEFTLMAVVMPKVDDAGASILVSTNNPVNKDGTYQAGSGYLIYKGGTPSDPSHADYQKIILSTYIGSGSPTRFLKLNREDTTPMLITITFSTVNGTTARVNGIEVYNSPTSTYVIPIEEDKEYSLTIGSNQGSNSLRSQFSTLAFFNEDMSTPNNSIFLNEIESGIIDKFKLDRTLASKSTQ